MTLNGHYALCLTIHASFGAHNENLNDNRPTLSAAKDVGHGLSFWQYNVYADMRRGFLEQGIKQQWGGIYHTVVTIIQNFSFMQIFTKYEILCKKKQIIQNLSNYANNRTIA